MYGLRIHLLKNYYKSLQDPDLNSKFKFNQIVSEIFQFLLIYTLRNSLFIVISPSVFVDVPPTCALPIQQNNNMEIYIKHDKKKQNSIE